MKYIFVLTLLLMLGAGCTTVDNESANLPVHTNDSIQNKSTHVIEESGTPSANSEETSISLDAMTDTNRTIKGQEDLAAEYDKAVLHTNLGDITVAFYADESPRTVNNFMNLAKNGEYDGTKFHRVIKDFMIQGGDLLSKDDSKEAMWGTGGPDYRFADEFNDEPLVRGSLAMANAGPNTNGSQFFIVTAPETPWLNGKHTNFGRVLQGMNVVDAIENTPTGAQDRPMTPVVLESIELIAR